MKRLIIAAAALLMLCSCENKEQKASRLEGEAIAQDNVIKYVEEKYGFTPELRRLVTDSHESMWGTYYSDHIIAEMTHEGREFIVYSAFDGSDAMDDYQQEEIQAALENEVKSRLPEARKVEISKYSAMRSVDYTGQGRILYNEYYDGQDLSTVLEDSTVAVYAVNADLSGDFDWFDQLTDPEKDNQIISYRSDEALDEKGEQVNWSANGETGERLKESLYIEEFRASGGLHEKYELTEFGGLTYVACDSTGAPADLHVEKTDDRHYTFTVPDGGCAALFLPLNCDTMRLYDNSEQFRTHLEGEYLQADKIFYEGKHTLVFIQ
ncbi:MAG: hypothetical protein IJ071_00500 [Ruminococcus sp.]|nr:hypothetical protein [Ruminococcus sp.]